MKDGKKNIHFFFKFQVSLGLSPLGVQTNDLKLVEDQSERFCKACFILFCFPLGYTTVLSIGHDLCFLSILSVKPFLQNLSLKSVILDQNISNTRVKLVLEDQLIEIRYFGQHYWFCWYPHVDYVFHVDEERSIYFLNLAKYESIGEVIRCLQI